MVVCCACGEKSSSENPVSFHSFPRNEKRRQQWLLQLHAEGFEVDCYMKICSKHFKPDCFQPERFGASWLKKDAIPTLFKFPPVLYNRVRENANIKQKTKTVKSRKKRSTVESETSSRRKYYLDFTVNDLNSPFKMNRFLLTVKQETHRHINRINVLIKKKKILAKRMHSLQDVLQILKQESLISQSASSVSELALPGSTAELVGRMKYGVSTEKYPPELCAFALIAEYYTNKHIKTCQRLLAFTTVIRQILQNSTKLLKLLPDLLEKQNNNFRHV